VFTSSVAYLLDVL